MSLDSAQLDEYLAFAIDLGKKAGEMIKDGQAKRFANKSSLDTKQNSIDVSATQQTARIIGDSKLICYVRTACDRSRPGRRSLHQQRYQGEIPLAQVVSQAHSFTYLLCSILKIRRDSIGEETYAETHEMELTDEWTWINDPIDGKSPSQHVRS
jgi:hypothetical protein